MKSSLKAGGFALLLGLILLPRLALGQWGDNVQRVSESLIWGPFHDVVVSDTLAFCAMGYGLTILDVSDSSHFQSLAVFGLPGQTEGLCLEGNYAYMASGSSGLYILDVSNPGSPVYVGGLSLSGYAYEAVKSGDFLYVADGAAGLKVVNVSQPDNPREVATLSLGGGALDLELEGSLLYIAAENAGLKVVNVATPSAPQVIGTYNSAGIAQGLRKVGNLVYLADGSNGVLVLNVSTPSAPSLVGQWPAGDIAHEVEVSGVYAYVADGDSGLVTLNVSNPGFPYQVTRYNTPGLAWSLGLFGQLLFLADDSQGLRSFSLVNPASPASLGSYANPGEVLSVWVQGNYAYAARGYQKIISVVDVSNPAQPLPVSQTVFADPAVELTVQNDTCYSAHLTGGIALTDVSDPLHPHLLDRRNTIGESYDVFPQQPYVEVADGSQGLVFLSWAPDSAWHLPTTGFAHGLLLRNDTMYVCQWNAGLALVNVSTPTLPQLLTQYATHGLAHHCVVVGGYIYVADDFAGLTIMQNGAVVGHYTTAGTVWDVEVAGNYAYLAAGTAGLIVLDITHPIAPVYAGSYQTPGIAQKIFLNGDDIYVADQFCLGIYRFTGSGVLPEPAHIPNTFYLSVHPNPFNPSTVASFELRVASHVSLKVYDLTGRLVRTLVNERLAAGSHKVTFDGSGLGSGLYFVRLEAAEGPFGAGDYTAVRKMVLLK